MRVKRGVTAHKKHKRLRAQVKGMSFSRRASVRLAKQAVIKSLTYGYRDRRNKKRDLRSLWITRLNAALDGMGISYSKFIAALKAADVQLNRKILAELAANEPDAFKAVVESVQK